MPRKAAANSSTIIATGVTNRLTLTEAMIRSGLLKGRRGKKIVSPDLRPLVDAIYRVLSGGNVKGTTPGTLIVSGGMQSGVDRFKRLEKSCVAAMNQVDAKFGIHILSH
jgi:hypothetical protein